MKVHSCSTENSWLVAKNNTTALPYSPTFGAIGLGSALNVAGGAMQWIQDKGFLASFLIQDGLGMTAPRVGAAFLRDKEVTGKYNIQEGFEVLGREGLTGPCMMAIAPITLALAAKFGRTTSVNSQLIKRFGNSLKEMILKPEFNKALLENKEQFKKEFFRTNIKNILENTLGQGNYTDESINFIIEQIIKYEKAATDKAIREGLSKGKFRSKCLNEIIEHINNLKYSTSSDLTMLDKLNVGSQADKVKAFNSQSVIEAMIKYSDDAISLNKNLNTLNENLAEDIKNRAIAKRFITNISTIAATLGVLSVLPKIYAKNDIAPGARTAMELQNKQINNNELVFENKNEKPAENNISFKGKSDSILGKFGKFISKHTKENLASELEYNGHNFTNTLMAGLSLFGLLAPRGMRAYNRALVDENGKKDLTELYEILIRDISSSLAVVFAVPMLTRAFVTSYEKKSGFVLMEKDRSLSKLKTVLDLLNPYSKAHVLTNSEISTLYNNITTREKMLNFCDFIQKNNGDLEKIISKSEFATEIFNEKALDIKELVKLSKSEKNSKIKEFIENLGKDGKLSKEAVNELITKVMRGTGAPKNNKILAFARGLNSVPGLITTFLISPYILGWFIPRLTYANTRRLHEKAAKEKEQQRINTSS